MISREYIAGLFDAEGTLNVRRVKGLNYGLTASISQNDSILTRELFYYFKEQFGGTVAYILNKSGTTLLNYTLTGDQAYIFLGFIEDCTIIKREQISTALKWADNRSPVVIDGWHLSRDHSEDESRKDQEITIELKRLKRVYSQYIPDQLSELPSLSYIAGFFDGDGFVGVYPVARQPKAAFLAASLTQNRYETSCKLFNTLKDNFGGNVRSDFSRQQTPYLKYQLNGDSAYIFLSCFQEFTVFKKEQIRIALEWQDRRSFDVKYISEKDAKDNVEVITKLKELKKASGL